MFFFWIAEKVNVISAVIKTKRVLGRNCIHSFWHKSVAEETLNQHSSVSLFIQGRCKLQIIAFLMEKWDRLLKICNV